jgi:hypothetical protein
VDGGALVSEVVSDELEPEEHALAITMRAPTARQRRITDMTLGVVTPVASIGCVWVPT